MTKSKNLKTARTFVYILLAVTTVAAVAFTIYSIISILRSPFTSFPWWSAFSFAAIYFLPFLVPEIACCVIFSIFYNKRAKAEQQQNEQ